ncbi:hypothetical protein DICSQDRAFT_56281 [Dichomitus squalens LYAD-421 SS1]|uniref:uncharacterized protein n=1 Tax=Dichomitus squalens (strain LYAD-421) TaxID=732165 RepID=UPI0004411C36|nr:uncharacterized protein DICSQDRAFT_56281 [Dichomitus squalens LYAD-421 SS1]EJF63239.1 hypothetical protein DICSQDRAFT_56281 [Dichomitus squalens LYAD-421 SS1]
MAIETKPVELSSDTVPLGSGLPTREELLVHYPANFTWHQMKIFVNSGDLGLLKRSKKLQQRYNEWAEGVKKEYGSIVNYLLSYRLQWGHPDTISLLRSSLDPPAEPNIPAPSESKTRPIGVLPPMPPDAPAYFHADMSKELYYVAMNDWPYSVPPEIEHSLIWSRVPFFPPDLPSPVESRISARLLQDGLWGFTGLDSPPPSPSLLPQALPALEPWGVTMDKLIRSPRGTDEEERQIKEYGKEIETFVKRRWNEHEWETAWFLNPPRLQSVPGLAHVHVFARHKSPEEIARATATSDP